MWHSPLPIVPRDFITTVPTLTLISRIWLLKPIPDCRSHHKLSIGMVKVDFRGLEPCFVMCFLYI